MRLLLAVTTLLLGLFTAAADAQTVTSVPDADTIVVAGVGKLKLAGITRAESRVGIGPTGPPPGPPSNPAMPPPLISGRVSLEPDRAGQRALRELVLGKKVRLEFDREADEKDRRVYVFLEDGTLVNAEMLRMGRARVDTSQAFERLAEFKAIEERAKEERRGIWARPSR
ncbi:MAG TPA: thermonuclease family protein [Vicinamibacterales bacterium]